jgi:transcriptional regulator with XRE-family HTH domain
MKVGRELAQAREQRCLSLAGISRRTKISVERLSAIERGDLEQLPEPVYLNRFLHAYAAEVHLDGSDVARRYLAELNQICAVGSVPSAAPGASDPAFAPGAVDDPANEFEAEADLQDVSTVQSLSPYDAAAVPGAAPDAEGARESIAERESLPEPEAPGASTVLPASHDPDVIDARHFEPVEVEKPVAPAASAPSSVPLQRHYRAILPVLAVAVVGVLLSSNFELLTRESSGSSENSATAGSVDPKTTDGSDAAARVPAPSAVPLPTSGDAGPNSDPWGASAMATAAADTGARGVPAERNPHIGTLTEAAEPTKSTPDRNVNNASHEDPDDLSGLWTLTNRVQSSSDGAFETLNRGYRLRLEQRGNRVTGTGQKWMEDGRPLPTARRTPITLEGTRNGQQLELNFTEKDTWRIRDGTFLLEVAPGGILQGTFVSDAANLRGSSLARRANSPLP